MRKQSRLEEKLYFLESKVSKTTVPVKQFFLCHAQIQMSRRCSRNDGSKCQVSDRTNGVIKGGTNRKIGSRIDEYFNRGEVLFWVFTEGQLITLLADCFICICSKEAGCAKKANLGGRNKIGR